MIWMVPPTLTNQSVKKGKKEREKSKERELDKREKSKMLALDTVLGEVGGWKLELL